MLPHTKRKVSLVLKKWGHRRWRSVFSLVGCFLLCASTVQASNALDLNVAGYELFTGIPCRRSGAPATCEVTFSGWSGGHGAVAGGWTSFPGNDLGFWEATIARQGVAAFGSTVTVLNGRVRFVLKQGRSILPLDARVTMGTVQWPASGTTLGCGTNVAHVTIDLQISELKSTATFEGCLHDLPAGSIIPPRIWGTFSIPLSMSPEALFP